MAVRAGVLVLVVAGCSAGRAQESGPRLPDAPSAVLAGAVGDEDGQSSRERAPDPCAPVLKPGEPPPLQGPPPCEKNYLQPIITLRAKELSAKEKGVLAIRNFVDPFNFLTITSYSAIATAANAHSSYGSGMAGFGRLTGYSLAQDAQGELFETFLIPSLVHEDPRYHRMPGASYKRRLLHAVAHTFVSQHDDGSRMPNYATLLTYPISAELSNLYVPGVQRDLRSTTKRVGIGLATDPAGSIVAEFLPDVARHIHVHVVFVQEILNAMIVGAPTTQ